MAAIIIILIIGCSYYIVRTRNKVFKTPSNEHASHKETITEADLSYTVRYSDISEPYYTTIIGKEEGGRWEIVTKENPSYRVPVRGNTDDELYTNNAYNSPLSVKIDAYAVTAISNAEN